MPTSGISTISSILSYGLSTVARQPAPGVSSLSTVISYGFSTLALQPSPGVSSLSTILSYGLSSLIAGTINPGVSSLSTILSYGLSSLIAGTINPGVSTLSTVVSYGLSTVSLVNSNTLNHTFLPSSIGGTDINRNNVPDTVTNAFAKIDTVFERLISKPPKPQLNTNSTDLLQTNFVGEREFNLNLSNPPSFYMLGQIVPTILYGEFSLSYSNTPVGVTNPYSNINLFTTLTGLNSNNPGAPGFLNLDGSLAVTTTSINFTMSPYEGPSNYFITRTSNIQYIYDYDIFNYSNVELSNNNPYIFKFRWLNNATYPPGSNNYFQALINFGNTGNFTIIN
jgi:hypothetical protein